MGNFSLNNYMKTILATIGAIFLGTQLPLINTVFYSGPIASSTSAVKVHEDPGNVFNWSKTVQYMTDTQIQDFPIDIDLNSDTVYDASASNIRLTVSSFELQFSYNNTYQPGHILYHIMDTTANKTLATYRSEYANTTIILAKYQWEKCWLGTPLVLPVSSQPLMLRIHSPNAGSGSPTPIGNVTMRIHGRLLSYP